MQVNQTHSYILGAGAIGHLLGCHYALNEQQVGLIYRGDKHHATERVNFVDHLQNSHSLTLNYFSASEIHEIKQLIVVVKAHQLAAALHSIKHALNVNSQILILSNGMGNLEEALDCLCPEIAPEQIWLGINTHGCYLAHNNQSVIHSGKGVIQFGQNYDVKNSVATPSFGLPETLHTSVVDDIKTLLWLKLAINAVINPLTAIHDCQNGQLLTDHHLYKKVQQLVKEIVELYALVGINLTVDDLQASCDGVLEATARNYSSMQRDVKNKNLTEIEAITGYLLKYAKSMQLQMLEHQYLYQQIKNIEQGHKLAIN